MRNHILLAAMLFCSTATADAPKPLTTAQVLDLMSRVPEKAHPSRVGHYERTGDAREIAMAIARTAPEANVAALMAVYAAYESSMQRCAIGDEGRSAGAWQLQYVPREVACDPARAASVWLALAQDASTRCPDSAPDDRLSILTGGSCSRGVLVARTRARIARQIASE